MKGSLENGPRRKLADISNLPQELRLFSLNEKSETIPNASKECIEKLKKENLALMKMLAERNKIIELAGTEIHKMRINLQKMQQQNQQLAHSNSQMLAELNSGKDRLKTLQHELGCKNGLLKAKMFEAEERSKQKKCQNNDEAKHIKFKESGNFSLANGDNDKPTNIKRRPQSKSLGSCKQVQSQDKVENKRPCIRRQSARFKSEALILDEDSFEVEDNPPMVNLVQENGSTSVSISPNDIESNPALSFESKEFGRSSLSRPLRQAAKKVQSYKEIPLNIKMRRTE